MDFETGPSLPAPLAGGQVHVWHCAVGDVRPFRQEWFSAEEKARADRFSLETPKAQFIAARTVLRAVLGQYLGRDPASLEFSIGEYGKPALRGTPGLEFNISHSGGRIMLALARDTPVGVDIEARRRLDHLDTLARRCLAPCEYAELSGLDTDAMTRGFLRLWVRKEALGKASGRGMALGLQRCVSSLAGPPRWLEIPPESGPVGSWSLAEIPVREEFEAAVTVHAANARFYWGGIGLDGETLKFEKLKSLLYATPDCVLGNNAAADSSRYPSR
ncbi:4'-phosphopantetheinyl transferase family protein [Methylococcus mesophilus]|uniref:4'-phosphopantetheinyl transferase family protein n=1 Tax=Methylococcus mesophilus TaxID=2993564 RepID=UPI00224A8972|nr:4'-phosphopantetheinyl transferase superfamily protein [Methylococcus mesophilus]UZR29298.1 4'-phosphopantetheinyl transferase superfamily protein [Methylococcus mesophilus]